MGTDAEAAVVTSADVVRRGLDSTHRHPAIAEAAAAVMVPAIMDAPHLENVFACQWDGERVTSARWLCRGRPDRAVFARGWLETGEIALHTHPGQPAFVDALTPSDADIDTGGELARDGIGSAIASIDLGRFLLLYPPTPPVTVNELRITRLLAGSRWSLAFTRSITRRLTA